MSDSAKITAVLGPTNTGKTHYAIERMLGHGTGVIGLPLRLLAREVYDKIVALRGPRVVALITGEERIIPDRPQYWVSTVEAMPTDIGPEFLAIDEIQLCADPERGHIFTDRLLHARGRSETLFLGSETMRGPIQGLVPKAQFLKRDRLSTLTYAGSKKISRIPARSAIVGFSVENVYEIAELLRRQKGGAAVVMGALSPRTRNAQVELYQNGDVDYLVATDAIGMGLNLDVRHVAFAGTAKFDGRKMRHLRNDELAQIAGRAGRYMTEGTFGVTADARPFDDETIQAIENHRFQPLRTLSWRNSDLRYGSVGELVRSLEEQTSNQWLSRAREADDLIALKALSVRPEISDKIRNARDVKLLWDIAQVPDYRGISTTDHASMLEGIHAHLTGPGVIPDTWLAEQINRLDRTEGDIDTLSRRLAFIRTWTYVAQRPGWTSDEAHWRGETRAVEDRLSDALHARLTQRFVDRRTSVLMRRLKDRESLVADVNDKGEVTVEGEFAGRLDGFRFTMDKTTSVDEARTLRQAAMQALAPEFHLRADRFYNAPDTELDFTEQGGLMWGTNAIGKLVAGPDPLKPQVVAFVDEEAGFDIGEKVKRRLQHFVDRKVAALFEPLMALKNDETITGLARGVAFRLAENFGILPRDQIAADVKSLDQDARSALRKHGIRFGQYTIFLPLLLKPAPTRLRLVLWSLSKGLQEFPESPPPGLVTIPNVDGLPDGTYVMSGYFQAGSRAIRIDMLERLADQLRLQDTRAGFEAKADMLSITGLTLDQFADLMGGLGYQGERAEREKVKVQPEKPKELTAEEILAEAERKAAAEAGEPVETAPETEVFYTFTWKPKPRPRPPVERRGERAPHPAAAAPVADGEASPPSHGRPQHGKPRRDRVEHGEGKPQGKPQGQRNDRNDKRDANGDGRPRKGGKPQRDDRKDHGTRTFSSGPATKSGQIDPDNPFAALLALKDKS